LDLANKQMVRFDSIDVNVIENSSGIFIGSNQQNYWNSASKSNLSIGDVSGGNNLFLYNINILFDNDFIDSTFGRSKYPPTSQQK
jgi:hypothetical protein